jgi:hypothetical protein
MFVGLVHIPSLNHMLASWLKDEDKVTIEMINAR